MNTRAKRQVDNERRHAVVLGASLAGLLAARVLSEFCAFNPVYGQGMTSAALGAVTLQKILLKQNGSLRGLSRRFQKQLAKMITAPWMMATGEDYRYRETVGGAPNWMTRFMHCYMDHVIQLATRSVAVRSTLMRVFNLMVTPSALFRPGVLFRVLLQVFKPAPRNVERPMRERAKKQVLETS